MVLLMAVCAAAFAGAAAVAVLAADLPARLRFTPLAAALLVLVAIVLCVVAHGARRGLAVAALLLGLACAGALYTAVEARRQYDALRTQFVAGREGRPVTLLTPDQTTDLARHMLTSVVGWLATITALPLALLLAAQWYALRNPSPQPSSPSTGERE
jgi:hypothetical protein